MHWHQLRSHVPQVFQVTSHIVGFRFVLRVVNSIVVAVPICSIFDLSCEFFVEIHAAKTGVLRCCLYNPRRLQQTAVRCKRSNFNKTEDNHKIVKVARLRFYPTTANNEFPVLSCRFACILIYRLSLNYYELHKESLHSHKLEEELGDLCRFWYFQ